jgi:hypothetical protein
VTIIKMLQKTIWRNSQREMQTARSDSLTHQARVQVDVCKLVLGVVTCVCVVPLIFIIADVRAKLHSRK